MGSDGTACVCARAAEGLFPTDIRQQGAAVAQFATFGVETGAVMNLSCGDRCDGARGSSSGALTPTDPAQRQWLLLAGRFCSVILGAVIGGGSLSPEPALPASPTHLYASVCLY